MIQILRFFCHIVRCSHHENTDTLQSKLLKSLKIKRILLLDYTLVGADGLQLLRAIAQTGRLAAGRAPRVLFCASAEDAIAGAARSAGAAGWVPRERVATDLMPAIRAVAEGGEWFPDAPAPAPAPVASAGRVLVAEDDAAMRGLLQDLLPQLGCSVSLAWRGEDVLERVTAEHFDLLILDHQLAGRLTGTEVMLEATRRQPALPVLFMTGLPDEVAAYSGHRNVCGVLSKPFRIQALRDEVRRILHSQQDPATLVAG